MDHLENSINHIGDAELSQSTTQFSSTSDVIKIRAAAIRKIIKATIDEVLGSNAYTIVNGNLLTKEIADKVNVQVKDLAMARYKHMVEVKVGQHTGSGSKLITRCRWDVSSDSLISESFSNDDIFCVVAVFLTYMS